jgi:hypothetical protein
MASTIEMLPAVVQEALAYALEQGLCSTECARLCQAEGFPVSPWAIGRWHRARLQEAGCAPGH